MTPLPRLMMALAFCTAWMTTSQAEDIMTFRVKGGNPGGVGGYSADVTLTKLSKTTAKVRWVAGSKKQVTEGFAIRTENAIGTAYGPGLYAFAVYELQGKRIHATWALATKPEESGTYELKGAGFEGTLPIADGNSGTVSFTPKKNGVFKVVWDLPSGRFEGIGLRAGNVLVAASGDMTSNFGVGTYTPKGDIIEGLWVENKGDAPGTEVWSLPEGNDAPVAKVDGRTVQFGGEIYELKENKSAPGQATSELREYLRKGEDWDGYSKMVVLRMQNVKTNAAGLAKSTLEQVRKQYSDAYIKEIEMGEETAAILFVLVTGKDVELNVLQYQKAGSGIASAHLVMRNKPPYDSQKKFKAEQDKQWDQWTADLTSLAENAPVLLAATAGKGVSESAPVTKKGGDEISPGLVSAIKGDMDKCAAIGQEFVGHIQAGSMDKAVALMSDKGFGKISREQFLQTIEKSNGVLGALKSYKPDKSATDFGVKEGVMTFTFQADAEYANGKVRETLTFIRNDRGGIEFIGYNRTAKE